MGTSALRASRAQRALAALACCALLVAACGDDDDVGADAGAPDLGFVIASPVAPSAPVLTPCPSGWREVRDGEDVAVCEPWPEAGRAVCSGDDAHFAGEAGCRAVSRACPTDGWPSELPAPLGGGTTRYVRAGASGSGTRDAPFGAIGDALAASRSGDVIAVGTGIYEEIVVVRRAVTIVGACASGAVLAGAVAPSGRGRLDVDAVDVVVRDLGVHGRGLGVWVSAGASATLERVVVRDVDLGGIVVLGSAQLREVLVRDVGPGAGGAFGRGVYAEGGARIDATRLVVERARELGVSLGGVGTSARLEDLVVSDTRGLASDDTLGMGVVVFGGAQLELARAVLEHNRFAGLNAGQAGTRVTATDLVVRDTEAQPDGSAGRALFVGGGASLTVQRGLFERDSGAEVSSYGADSTVELTDCVLRETRPRPTDGAMGVGVVASEGGAITLARVAISRVAAAAALVDGAGSALVAEDVSIDDVVAQRDGTNGAGIVVDRGATLTLTRAALSRLVLTGIFTGEDARSTLTDVAIRAIESQPADGRFGHGVEVANRGTLDATRLTIEDTRGVALSAFDGATLRASDVSVLRTRAMACGATTCADRAAGVGALSRDATLALTRFFITDAALCGVQVALDGALDLVDGELARHPIGASVLVDGYDVARLMSGVAFRENERNFDARLLPVPDPALPQLAP